MGLSSIYKNINLYIIVTIFCTSRIVYSFLFGLHFDESTLTSNWQYIDPPLLKGHLLQSVYYLHSQPPLFNLFMGGILKLFPHDHLQAFHLCFMLVGLLFFVSLFLVMTQMGVRSGLSLFLTSLFMVSPIILEYENWLSYEYPTTAILTFSLLFLYRFTVDERSRDCFTFFLLLVILIYIRGFFNLYWFLLIMSLLLMFYRRDWRKLLLACLLPLTLVLALYIKNYLIFNSFSTGDAQIGINLARVVTDSLPPSSLKDLIAREKISGLNREPAFSNDFLKYKSYGIRVEQTGIPVLDQKLKSSNCVNTHNLIYLEVGKIDIKDAIYVFKHYPGIVLKNCASAFIKNYFLTADITPVFYNSPRSKEWKELDNFFKIFFLGKQNGGKFLFLMIGLPMLFSYGSFLVFRLFFSKHKNISIGVVIVFMMVTIICVALISLFSWGDQNRYRFSVDPFYLILFGLLINDLYSEAKTLCGRAVRLRGFTDIRYPSDQSM